MRVTNAAALWLGVAFGVAGLLASPGRAGEFPDPTYRVPQQDIVAAMQQEAAKGYNLLVSTTSTRFTTSVLLELVAKAQAVRPQGPPLLLHYDDWCESFRVVTGLDSSALPAHVALQREYAQSQYVDYRPEATRVEVREGPVPRRVVRVHAGWPDTPGAAGAYTFTDTVSNPRMLATNERFISYWIVQYPDMIMQDKIEGLKGRPLEGALGTLFSVIGEGRAVQARFAVAEDGLQITRAHAKKAFFSVHPTTTTYPNGNVQKGLPDGRPDLEVLESLLKRDLKISYPKD